MQASPGFRQFGWRIALSKLLRTLWKGFQGRFGMHSFAWWPTLAVVGVATITDLRSRRIPNWLVLPFLPLGIAVSSWFGGWHGFEHSLEGAGLGILIFGILYLKFGMGAGDVKLCAAIGAWIGPSQFLVAAVLTALAGGLVILIWAMYRGLVRLVKRIRREEASFGSLMQAKMPYAPAIAIGTLMSFFFAR
jgi:prepilin peptidase CpaA